jgi:selenide,water dikinase
MVTLNSLGEILGQIQGVKAMTDVTGFGLLGHLTEMCEGSHVSATIEFDKIPRIASLPDYLSQKCIPGGTGRNWASYGHKVGFLTEEQRYILADPQTSGGLLIAAAPEAVEEVAGILRAQGLPESRCQPFGILESQEERLIQVSSTR